MSGTVSGPEATTIRKTKSLKESLMGERRHNTCIDNEII